MYTQPIPQEPLPSPFPKNRLLQALVVIFVAFWIAMGLKPVYPYDWWIENILTFATAAALILSYRRFRFSDVSYVLITVFFLLHTYSAHYAYSQVPIDWLNQLFGRPDRMNFDRVVHLCYGLMLTYPIWELLRRAAGVRGAWPYLLAVITILATGAIYELLEMWIAMLLAPGIADAFVGTQGDIWDPQMDMALAMYGGTAAMLATWIVRRLRR